MASSQLVRYDPDKPVRSLDVVQEGATTDDDVETLTQRVLTGIRQRGGGIQEVRNTGTEALIILTNGTAWRVLA